MSNDKLAEIRVLAARLQNAAYDHGAIGASDRGSAKKYADADYRSRAALTTLMDKVSEALQAHAAEAARAQAQVPGAKYPDDGCGDEDSYNAGWNACRDAVLAETPQQAAEPLAWPFVESPGEIADRLKGALENGCPLLGAVRQVFIENPPLYTHPQPAQDAKLPSDEDFRLHLGELTHAELRVAQAAARYVLAGERAQPALDAKTIKFVIERMNAMRWGGFDNVPLSVVVDWAAALSIAIGEVPFDGIVAMAKESVR